MKSEKNIFIAFILNLAFSIFELLGGIFTNSVAIISDSVHDIGDAVSIRVADVKIDFREIDFELICKIEEDETLEGIELN